MKKLVVIFLLLFARHVVAQKIFQKQDPPQAVNDFGNFLEPFQKESLEKKIRAYNDSTSSAIVIITVPDLQGYDIAEVALKYMREWKPGMAGKDNGVIILVSKAERKARIETGYGMEGVLPDITCRQIIDDRMIPYFKESDYYRGFDNAVDAIVQAAAGEYKAEPAHKKGGGVPIKAIIILGVIFFIIISFLGGGGFGGGGFGGGGGGGGFGGFGGGGGGGGGASGGW